MTAAVEPRPYLSGFCGYSGRHDLCVHPVPGMACSCPCHSPSPSAPDRAADAAPAALVLISESGREPQPDSTGLSAAVDTFDQQVGGWFETAGHLELLDLLVTTRTLRQRLAQIEGVLEASAAKAMPTDRVEWPGGVAERRGGAKRTAWEHDRVAHRVAEHAALSAAVVPDPDTGEAVLDEELAAAVHAGVQELLACANPSWRTTALKKRDIRYDDLCHTEYGRRTVQISPAGEQ